jgi:hypothetical protein
MLMLPVVDSSCDCNREKKNNMSLVNGRSLHSDKNNALLVNMDWRLAYHKAQEAIQNS